jgi:glycosyltransferase involved in cell wall biosynthesis
VKGTTGTVRVSVVINNHNYAPYLGEAVESALNQTLPGVEVVVVDDGSTDQSRQILEGFGDRIRAVYQERGGQAAAVNRGWQESRGELVLLLDADDALDPRAAERVAEVWRPGVATVRFPLWVVDGSGREKGSRVPTARIPRGKLASRVLRGERVPAPPTSGTAYHRDTAGGLLPIPADWEISADAYLNTLVPLLGEVEALDEPLGRYRLHGANRWALDTPHDPGRLRRSLAVDDARREALARMARELGLPAPAEDWPGRDPEHLQKRLALLCLDPDSHPGVGDSRLALGFRGARAALATRAFRPGKRLLFAAWFLAVSTLPRQWTEPLIARSYGARTPGGS